MRVLVLDDNPDDRQLVLRELLAEYPQADAVEIIDERRFGEVLDQAEPALVVTDLDLRWLNGLEVLRRVKGRYPDCPVIMFTGTGDEVVAVDAMKAGLDDYVVKSARQLPRLRASIRQVLTGSAATRSLRHREEELRAALAHKDLILRELHHRVKNNIQIMTSLLWMRGRQATSDEVKRELAGIRERMQVLGNVQAHVYETEDLDRVDFEGVIGEIAASLVSAHGGEHIRLDCNLAGGMALPVHRAMPLALIVYEVVLNALKHGLADRSEGTLTLRLLDQGERRGLLVRDDGKGFTPAGASPGVGTRLINALAREAGASIEREADGEGTSVTIWIDAP